MTKLDRIYAPKIIEQRMVSTKHGPRLMYVIEATTAIKDSLVSITGKYVETVELCDEWNEGKLVNCDEETRKVGFWLGDEYSFGINYVAIEIDNDWYGLGDLTHYGHHTSM